MIIRWSVIFAIVLFVPEACKPQDVIEVSEPVVSGAPHSVYAEMGGNGLFACVNYDYLFMSGFGFRFGAGLSGLDRTDRVSFPLAANYVLGESHRMEFGVGVVFWGRDSQFHPMATVGYRFQQSDGGMFYRANLNPLILLDEYWGLGGTDMKGRPSISFSVGYSF